MIRMIENGHDFKHAHFRPNLEPVIKVQCLQEGVHFYFGHVRLLGSVLLDLLNLQLGGCLQILIAELLLFNPINYHYLPPQYLPRAD